MHETDILFEIEYLKKEIKYHEACIKIKKDHIAELEERVLKEEQFDTILSIKEISGLLCVSEETVRRWIRNGRLIANANSKKEGYCIKQHDFEEFLSYNKKYFNMVHYEET